MLKNMVNNKELIKPLLVFPKPGDSFYFVQILQRKKDHKGETLGGSNNNSRLVKAYHLNSIDKLEHYWDEMVKLAEVFEARVSINLNPRSFEKAGFQVMAKIADQMQNGDFYNIRRAYDGVCGNYHAETDKRWLIDIDKEDISQLREIEAYVDVEHRKLQEYPEAKDYKRLVTLPSKSGFHIITNPFDVRGFSRDFPSIEIHKNNPCNIFIPDSVMNT